jgi:hypothetical protein
MTYQTSGQLRVVDCIQRQHEWVLTADSTSAGGASTESKAPVLFGDESAVSLRKVFEAVSAKWASTEAKESKSTAAAPSSASVVIDDLTVLGSDSSASEISDFVTSLHRHCLDQKVAVGFRCVSTMPQCHACVLLFVFRTLACLLWRTETCPRRHRRRLRPLLLLEPLRPLRPLRAIGWPGCSTEPTSACSCCRWRAGTPRT